MPLLTRSPVPVLAALLLTAACALRAGPASGGVDEKVHDDEKLNYELHVPGNWEWGRPADYAKHGGVEVADRKLATLADGTPANGEGARAVLTVQDVPAKFEPDYETWLRDLQVYEGALDQLPDRESEAPTNAEAEKAAADVEKKREDLETKVKATREKIERALESLGGMPEVAQLLLVRYGEDAKSWPRPDLDARAIEVGKMPAVRLQTDAQAANLSGNVQRCAGRMFAWILRKKLFRLVMWRWPTKSDRERLRDDWDFIELQFGHLKREALPRKPNDAGPAVGADSTAATDPELGQRMPFTELAMGFQVVKPAGFHRRRLDRALADQTNTGFQFEASDAQGTRAYVDLLVYRLTGGGSAFTMDEFVKRQWTQALVSYPDGRLSTFPFPAITSKGGYLALPDFSKPSELKRPPPGETDKTSRSDLERVGFATEAKNAKIGREKLREPWRVTVTGYRKAGREYQAQYCFSTATRTYVLRVYLNREQALEQYTKGVQEILNSFELLDEK